MEIPIVDIHAVQDQLQCSLAELSWWSQLDEAMMSLTHAATDHYFDEKMFMDQALQQALKLSTSAAGLILMVQEFVVSGQGYRVAASSLDAVFTTQPAASDWYDRLWTETRSTTQSRIVNNFSDAFRSFGPGTLQRSVIVPLRDASRIFGHLIVFNAARDYTSRDVDAMEHISPLVRVFQNRVKAGQKLDRQRAILAAAERIAGLGSWEYNRVTHVTTWSQEMYRIHGLDPSAGVPSFERLASMVHEEDRDQWVAMITDATRSGTAHDLEFRIIRPDGTVRWLLAHETAWQATPGHDPQRLFGTMLDITDSKVTREALRRSQELLAHTQRLTHMGTWEYIPATRTTIWSAEMFALHGLDPDGDVPPFEVLSAMVHPDDRPKWLAMINAVTSLGTSQKIEYRLMRPDGQQRWILSCEGAVLDEGIKMPVRFYGTLLDITEQKAMEEELRYLATYDSLTKCYNRYMIFNVAESEFDRARRYRRDLSILIMDIDFFKQVNDTYGHGAGDEVLRKVCALTVGELRTPDFLGRMGGEEFLIILPESDHEAAVMVANRIRESIDSQEIGYGSQNIHLTVSIGVAQMQESDETFERLVYRADHALYRCKAAGRNKVIFEEERSGQLLAVVA